MRAAGWLFVVLLLSSLGATAPAWAQSTALSQVERAYADVDFDKTRALAKEALERGGNDHTATARLYLLWATAAAALDQAEEARLAFRHVLAADPELRLDRSLSPKIRAPYLEARGSLDLERGKAPLEATLQRRQRELELGLRDTLQVAASVELSTRLLADEPFVRQRFEPQPLRRIPTPSGRELEFFVQVLDRRGNVLFEHGSREEPQRLALVSSGQAPLPTAEPTPASRTPYYATSATLGALGVASGVVATLMYVRREDAARQWNGPDCEQPGRTRGAQCGDIDARRERSENLAIGFTAAGGALLVGSIVSLLLVPSRPSSQTALGVEAAPRSLALTWRQAL